MKNTKKQKNSHDSGIESMGSWSCASQFGSFLAFVHSMAHDQKRWPALAASVALSFLAGLLKVGQHRLLSVDLVALGGLLQSSAWAHGQHVLGRL